MQTLFTIAPLAIICLLGFLLAKNKSFSQPQIGAISKFCFTVLIPTFLFRSTYLADLSANVNLQWFLTFYIPVVSLFLIIYFISKWINKRSAKESAILALAGSYSNTVLISIPILASLFSEAVSGLAFMLIAFHSAVLFSLTEHFAATTTTNSLKSADSGLFKSISRQILNLLSGLNNPIVISISAGLLANVLNIQFHDVIMNSLTMIASAAIPPALFTLGASIYFLPLKGNRTTALILSSCKLLVLPALVYCLGSFVFSLTTTQTFIACVLAASPTGANAFLVANKHGAAEAECAATVVFSTIFCVITLLVWLAFLK